MTPDQALKQEAAWFANSMRSMRGVEDRPDESAINMRLMSYTPQWHFGTQALYICPKCWISHQLRNPLHPAPGNSEYDVLRCGSQRDPRACGGEFIIPF